MLEIRYAENELWKNDITSNNGKIEPTVDNMVLILNNDVNISSHILYNDFSRSYEYVNEGEAPRSWSDGDDARVMAYMEKAYGIYNFKK